MTSSTEISKSSSASIAALQNADLGVSFSSGFFGFFQHAGVLKALVEKELRIRRVTGTSAGAIVAAMYAAGKSPEEICDTFLSIRRTDFWDLTFPFSKNGFRLLKGNRFKQLLQEILGDITFDQLNIPASFGVLSVDDGRSRYLYSGQVVEAVLASCALPYLFPQIKIDNRWYMDGGIQEKSPLQPFFDVTDIDTVVASILPPREQRGGKNTNTNRLSFFVDTPLEERLERERASLSILEARQRPVFTIRPSFVPVSPFHLHKANEAMQTAYEDTIRLLESPLSE